MTTKYKKGIERYEFIAVCKIDDNVIMYNPPKLISIKQYLTRKGIVTDSPLDYLNIVPNPYKDIPKCHCRLCSTSYKDETNKSGQLTLHIQREHVIDIKDYISLFPDEAHLFQYNIKGLSQSDPSLTSEDSRIQCPLCSKYFKAIKSSHAKVHGMTLAEFREAAGMQNLLSKASTDRVREVYYQENGLSAYKKPSKPKEPKVKKNKSRKTIRQFVSGVDYQTYDTNTLLAAGAHCIYKFTFPSHKCYIGRTGDFFERMSSHKYDAKNGNMLAVYCAIRKYGWENVIIEIIDIVATVAEAKLREGYWITFFDSYKNGYNSTDKTDGGHSWEGQKDTQKYLDYIENLSSVFSGEGSPNYGSKRSEETKALMKIKAKGRNGLEWFQAKYGEDLGLQKYNERTDKLRNRTDQRRNAKGHFVYD